MARPDKVAAVAELKESFSESAAVVLTDYRGLTVKNLKDLRRSMAGNATYTVAKNTLAILAAREAGIEGLDDKLVGPTALTFINGDIATVAKGLRDFAKEHPHLIIKGGVLDGAVLDADSVKKLADLESREVLLAKLAGAMKASLQQAVFLFAAPLGQAARTFGALEAKAQADPSVIGGAGSAPAAAPAAEVAAETPAAQDSSDAAASAQDSSDAAASGADTADAALAVGDTEDAPAASSTEAAADAAADTE